MIRIAYLFALPTMSRRWWTGENDLSFGGETWTPAVFEAGDIRMGGAPTPVQVEIPAGDDMERTIWLQGPGYIAAEVRMIYRGPTDTDWQSGPRVTGRLGAPVVSDAVVQITVDPELPPAPFPLVWSDESQQQRTPGDLGFSQLTEAALEGGSEASWP